MTGKNNLIAVILSPKGEGSEAAWRRYIMSEKNYYVYILTTKHNRVLYVGMTNDLERRIMQHKNKIHNGFTARYGVDKLVYFEESDDVGEVIAREKEIKGWLRKKKIDLINSDNPEWRDLSKDWF